MLSVDEVEKRIGEVPGVERVTVNFVAESATVRYDETRLEVSDIKSAPRLRAHEPKASEVDAPVVAALPAAAAAAPAPMPKPGAPTMPAGMTMPGRAASAGDAANAPEPSTSPDSDTPDAATSMFQKQKSWLSPTGAEDTAASPSPPAVAHKGHAGHGGTPSPMSPEMAEEMSHGDNMDLARLPTLCKDLQVAQLRHLVAPQASVKPRARNSRIDELSHYHQQVIERQQQQRAPESDHHSLLPRRQRGAELVRTVREVLQVVPAFPFARRGLAHVVALCQLCQTRAGRLDFRSRSRCCSGLRMYLAHAVCSAFMASITPHITSLARNNGQLRIGK